MFLVLVLFNCVLFWKFSQENFASRHAAANGFYRVAELSEEDNNGSMQRESVKKKGLREQLNFSMEKEEK